MGRWLVQRIHPRLLLQIKIHFERFERARSERSAGIFARHITVITQLVLLMWTKFADVHSTLPVAAAVRDAHHENNGPNALSVLGQQFKLCRIPLGLIAIRLALLEPRLVYPGAVVLASYSRALPDGKVQQGRGAREHAVRSPYDVSGRVRQHG